ncbi:cation diffusion facilitator family transporter [Brevundimonas sp.]|uniref:cation diffusion facilitator family transporter n=1 Tax=Brevundimonas sp. TaxID=1871086 RepID=UPI00272F550E|nr:cation diffusion facilitator family transporter [Brevundimonas sp.]MDP1912104.1 cation diffusion facilitator family transporter [Brevundimonas sp.]
MGQGHDHGAEDMPDGRLVAAVAVNVLLTVAQIIGGVVSGSLSLIADALHNLNDAASLALALFARKIGRRPADKLMTFGYGRAEVVAALINLTTLIIVGLYLIYEAVSRFINPQPIDGWIVIGVAGIALVIDVATAVMVHAGSKNSLNIRAAFLHNVSDALASVGVIIAGVLILLYDLYVADLIITLVISAYVLWQGFSLLPKTIRILMGATPDDLEFDRIVAAIATVPGVSGLHHVHVWSVDEHTRSLEAHIVLATGSMKAFELTKNRIRAVLKSDFSIAHATLEPCTADLSSDPASVKAHSKQDRHHGHTHGDHG